MTDDDVLNSLDFESSFANALTEDVVAARTAEMWRTMLGSLADDAVENGVDQATSLFFISDETTAERIVGMDAWSVAEQLGGPTDDETAQAAMFAVGGVGDIQDSNLFNVLPYMGDLPGNVTAAVMFLEMTVSSASWADDNSPAPDPRETALSKDDLKDIEVVTDALYGVLVTRTGEAFCTVRLLPVPGKPGPDHSMLSEILAEPERLRTSTTVLLSELALRQHIGAPMPAVVPKAATAVANWLLRVFADILEARKDAPWDASDGEDPDMFARYAWPITLIKALWLASGSGRSLPEADRAVLGPLAEGERMPSEMNDDDLAMLVRAITRLTDITWHELVANDEQNVFTAPIMDRVNVDWASDDLLGFAQCFIMQSSPAEAMQDLRAVLSKEHADAIFGIVETWYTEGDDAAINEWIATTRAG